MLIFVNYDISDNNSRSSLIKRLQHYGLHRIQKSIFVGYLDIDYRLDLASEFDSFISSDKDSIILIPICESCANSILLEGEINLPKEEHYKIV